MVEDILQAVADLSRELGKRQSLEQRIEGMRDGQRSFLRQLAAIAAELGIPDDTTEPLDLWRTITDRVRQARASELAHGTASQALREAKVLQDNADETQSIHLGRKKEMTAFFGVSSLAEVAAKLADIEKRTDLQNQADATTREILEGLRLSSMPEAEARLGCVDRAALEAEFTELTARFADQDERTRDLFEQP